MPGGSDNETATTLLSSSLKSVKFQLMLMLCHQYPRVRKSTSSKLFELLLNLRDFSSLFDTEEDYVECMSLLSDTDWDETLDRVRTVRNKICDLTKTPKPVVKKAL